jgi:hypothetical protein
MTINTEFQHCSSQQRSAWRGNGLIRREDASRVSKLSWALIHTLSDKEHAADPFTS